MRTRSPVEYWIFREFAVDERSLAVTRILTALTLLVLSYPRYVWMAEFPASMFTPPLSLAMFFRSPPPLWMLWAMMFMLTALCVALLAGYRTRTTGLMLAGGMVAANSFDYSWGKINHDILLVLLIGVMSFSGWGRRFSVDASRRGGAEASIPLTSPRWPLCLMSLLIGLAMVAAGLPKLTTGWLDPSSQAVKGWLLFNIYGHERHTLGGDLALAWMPNWMWESLDWKTIALELAFLPAALSLRGMRFITAVATLFHAGVHFMLEIFFVSNLVVYAAFVDWQRVLPAGLMRRLESSEAALARIGLVHILVIAAGLTAFYVLVGNPAAATTRLVGGDLFIVESVLAVLAAVLGVAYLARWVRAAWTTGGGTQPIVLFDGVCGLCNRTVNFVLARDPRGMFRFVTLQSERGARELTAHGYPPDYTESVVVIIDGAAYSGADAILQIVRRLGLRWSPVYWASVLVPPVVRDVAYRVIAVNRFRWFGKLPACRLPTPEERGRFLE